MQKFNIIDIPSGTEQFTGELYEPSETGKTGLVVLVYGTDGFVDNERGPWQAMMRGYAEELATHGLFALIPDYFAKTGSPHGGPAANDILTKRHSWAAALVDTVAHARALPRVDPSRIGTLGFSLGGYLCLLTRATTKPKALVEFFAPLFDGIGPRGVVPFAQIHHGTKDKPPTDFANAAAIAGMLKLEGTDVTVFEYKDATHGFAGTTAADKKAAADSKASTVKFFETRL
jgi:dienelactone hydrolase